MGWLETALLAGAVFFAAALLLALTGFGFALIAVPLLALFLDPRAAVVAVSAVAIFLSGGIAIQDRRHIAWEVVRPLTLLSLVGLPVGLLVLKAVDASTLKLIIAGIILATVVLVALGVQLPVGRASTAAAGFCSGVLQSSTSMGGPPLVLAAHARNLAPSAFRGTIVATSVVQGALSVVAYLALGFLQGPVLPAIAAGTVAVPLGWWVGDRIFARIRVETFRKLVLICLACTALAAIWGARSGG